ncbi:hypothetical protein TNCV_4865011 [Trichonephila clavipes]|nr:hypothetical protein TNCV_4865011 [Trichonephila clavipes]
MVGSMGTKNQHGITNHILSGVILKNSNGEYDVEWNEKEHFRREHTEFLASIRPRYPNGSSFSQLSINARRGSMVRTSPPWKVAHFLYYASIAIGSALHEVPGPAVLVLPHRTKMENAAPLSKAKNCSHRYI